MYSLKEIQHKVILHPRNTKQCVWLIHVIAVCIYHLVIMSIDLSKKFTSHVQTVTGSMDVIVTQLLRYHMLLLYCMQPSNLIHVMVLELDLIYLRYP